ncbi:hypothetical protein [Rossellomorea aquimaris]|uniref:hypothetical protein n=1 Tax=Rossellomorea aquimaris TaxID=189382 RepID=UPI001CFE82E9|nr:hypothetical protein [Rossellomorea aquimaris]
MTLIVLTMGLIVYFIGNSKKNPTIKGMGIGFILALCFLKIPNFIEGFIQGVTKGFMG